MKTINYFCYHSENQLIHSFSSYIRQTIFFYHKHKTLCIKVKYESLHTCIFLSSPILNFKGERSFTLVFSKCSKNPRVCNTHTHNPNPPYHFNPHDPTTFISLSLLSTSPFPLYLSRFFALLPLILGLEISIYKSV